MLESVSLQLLDRFSLETNLEKLTVNSALYLQTFVTGEPEKLGMDLRNVYFRRDETGPPLVTVRLRSGPSFHGFVVLYDFPITKYFHCRFLFVEIFDRQSIAYR